MAFLSRDELQRFIGKNYTDLLVSEPDSFEEAEAAAAAIIYDMTGIAAPDDIADAPLWAKRPAAHIILNHRIGIIAGISPERIAWANGLYNQAIEFLRSKKVSPDTPTHASTDTIDGMATW